MLDERRFSVSDLVLEVSPKLNPRHFDLDAYEPFIDLVTQGREFQAEAIRTALRFLAGGEYASTEELARENYAKNPHLDACYGSADGLVAALPFADRLSCSIDLATGTGKSYVIYALAHILLNERTVDRVLVLCPSTTIEAGLLDKFRALSADRELREALPRRKGFRNRDITQASSTIEPGHICVENIHAVYLGTKSSIADSLGGKGASTLVLNDEAHHIFSPTDKDLKKWKSFLDEPAFGFRRIVGFSGTCFVGNEYFSDVIYRYSLVQATEENQVKRVWYVDEDKSRSEAEAFQKIAANHERNRRQYRPLKPLTILVTKDIKAAQGLTDRLIRFLRKQGQAKRSKSVVDKVLLVTSHKDHRQNAARLPLVDGKRDPTEWIVSVSMLTEGWDVKNVFQIVPHEQRAFNSKLLIAQVLGRGLRIPDGLDGRGPEVTVFNHERWAPAIRHLVDEVMEHEARIASYSVSDRAIHNFKLHQLRYKATERTETISPARGDMAILKKGFVKLAPQAKATPSRTRYRRAGGTEEREETVRVSHAMRSVSDVAVRVLGKLKAIDLESGTRHARAVTQRQLENIIKGSLSKIGASNSLVSEENEQKILSAFGPLTRKRTKQVRLTVQVERVEEISTSSIPSRSISLGALRKEAGLFYDETSLSAGDERDRNVLGEIEGGHPYGGAVVRVPNPYSFKVPTNLVLVTHRPERAFARELLRSENAKAIDAWIKSPDSGFYEIEYSWRKGEHQKQAAFNPDFFISVSRGKDILVVETKTDTDVTDENRGKLKYAQQHFAELNWRQRNAKYHFYFLSPKDYDIFFQSIRDKTFPAFRSELHVALENGGVSEAPRRTSKRAGPQRPPKKVQVRRAPKKAAKKLRDSRRR